MTNNNKEMQPNFSKITEYYSHYIQYHPELRKYVGSINSALLLHQLERWFSYKNDTQTFYKFLSPCNHPNYRVHDSWVEELGFTEAEFRSAFDSIGIRYRSKGQFLEALKDENNDPFQGKYYLSYIDVKLGLTYYLRNDDAINQLFNEITDKYQPTALRANLSDEDNQNCNGMNSIAERVRELVSVSTKISPHKVLTLEIKKSRSESKEFLSPNKEQEIQQEITSKKTAAEEIKEKFEITAVQKTEFAAAQFKKQDFEIGKELTPHQVQFLESYVETHFETSLKTLAPKEVLLQAIKAEILNPKSFIQARQDFNYKFNSIKTLIRKNQWHPQRTLEMQPQKKELQKLNKTEQKIKSLQDQIRAIELDKNGCLYDLENWKDCPPMQESRKLSLEICDKALKPLVAELAALKQMQKNKNSETHFRDN